MDSPQRTQRTQSNAERAKQRHPVFIFSFFLPSAASASSAVQSSRPSRRGISLLEVLIAIAILSIGLLGVAALIPIARLALMEIEKSDRTGACGRAVLRDVKVRRLLDSATWYPTSLPITNVFVIDPLYYAANTIVDPAIAPPIGSLSRVTFGPLAKFGPLMLYGGDSAAVRSQKKSLADQMFRWRDDLIFDIPSGSSMRPRAVVQDINGLVGSFPTQTPPEPALTAPVTPQSEGNASWFLTVSPATSPQGIYNVAVVVCYGRNLRATGSPTPLPEGEASVTSATSPALTLTGSPGYGGVSISIAGPWPTNWNLKSNQWILLYSTDTSGNIIQATWYRIANAGYDGTNTRITLVGPDWYGGTSNITAVSVQGVTGVYYKTIQLDQ